MSYTVPLTVRFDSGLTLKGRLESPPGTAVSGATDLAFTEIGSTGRYWLDVAVADGTSPSLRLFTGTYPGEFREQIALTPADGVVAPTAAQVAAQVRAELATELARIDVGIGTRMGTFTYTAPPTAAVVATQVRAELATELGRIDAAISTRSTYAGGPVAGVTSPVTVGTVNDKTGYSLASTGLNGIDPTGASATSFLGKLYRHIQRFRNSTRNKSTGEITTRDDAGNTIMVQASVDSDTTESISPPTS